MDVIIHETVRLELHPIPLALLQEHTQVELLVVMVKKDPLAAIAPLCHVMRKFGDGHPR